MLGLETWFIFAVLSALVGGIGAFSNKVAASRKYNTQFVLIVNSLLSIVIFGLPALYFEGFELLSWPLILVVLLSGLITSVSAYIKIQVLHYIDSAIFLPLFKVLGPLIVIIFGLIFFDESFTNMEWFGLAISLMVPLLLVSRVENSRQSNLRLGLMLILVCAVTSAIAAALLKYATDIASVPLWIMVFIGFGILLSASAQYAFQFRGQVISTIRSHFSIGVVQVCLVKTVLAGGGAFFSLLAFVYGGPLGIVYTINSLYILPSIILAIIIYDEHWNFRKALAIFLSVVALAMLQ